MMTKVLLSLRFIRILLTPVLVEAEIEAYQCNFMKGNSQQILNANLLVEKDTCLVYKLQRADLFSVPRNRLLVIRFKY